jgi:hypothetical protein
MGSIGAVSRMGAGGEPTGVEGDQLPYPLWNPGSL